jgi:hypothetical protein
VIKVHFQCGEDLGQDRLIPNWTWSGGFEFANEVVLVTIECLQHPGVDALKAGFCKIDALYDTLVDSVDAGEDVAGGDSRMVRSLKAVPCRGCWVRLMESDFRELDAFGDAVVHLIYPGD